MNHFTFRRRKAAKINKVVALEARFQQVSHYERTRAPVSLERHKSLYSRQIARYILISRVATHAVDVVWVSLLEMQELDLTAIG